MSKTKRVVFVVVGMVLVYTAAGYAGWLTYTVEVKLKKDHKAGEVVRCSSLTTSFFDKKHISCEEK